MTKESFGGGYPQTPSRGVNPLCTSLLLNDLVSYALPIAGAM
jgi:hypothetical protein